MQRQLKKRRYIKIYNHMSTDNKFQNEKIYRIVDVAYNKCYYGSTIETLSRRMAHHKLHHKKHLNNEAKCNRSVNVIFDEYGIENCKIELVERFPCETKEEMRKREGFYIQNNDCVNKHIAGRSKREYQTATREHKNQKQRDYYQQNKIIAEKYKVWAKENREKLLQRKREYGKKTKEKRIQIVTCECGKQFQICSKQRHEKGERHKQYLQTLQQQSAQ